MRAGQPRLADGSRLDDRIGYRFAVLARPNLIEALSAGTRRKLDNAQLALVSADGESADYLAEMKAAALLIRPDRYILDVASTPAKLETALARIPGLLARHVAQPTQKTATT
jgi:3-(3-hydroxy-phenyl)propionate hydroxylase